MTERKNMTNSTRMTRRHLLAAGGATLGALALPRGARAQAGKDGGTFTSARTTEATGLDPQLVPAFSRSARSPMMYNQLVRFDPDMTPVPELAESWQVSRDGLAWTFKLRQGVKFHDGQELTSADVKFTFDRLFEKSPGKSDFIAVDKVEPTGKYGVKFTTKEPFAGLLAALGGFWGFIINEAGVKKHGDLNKAAVGTGPFMLEDWKVEQQMVLKKNPHYFKKGLPHVDQVILRVIPDEANIVAALRTGQIQHAFIEDNKNFNLLKDEKSLTGYRASRLGYDFLNINASRGPLKRLGTTAELENLEYAVWIKRWLAKDFDMTMNTTPGYADPDTAFFRALHSTKGQNWNSWSVPDVDALLEEGRRTMDPKKRKEIYDRVQIMILENVPHLWLFSADTIDFTQTSVKGFRQHPTTLLYGFEGVWLDKA